MLIYLLRHGIAETTAIDKERLLTREGLMQTRSTIEKFRMREPTVDKAIMSGYQRARQSAGVLRTVFPQLRIQVDPQIEPDADVYGTNLGEFSKWQENLFGVAKCWGGGTRLNNLQ